MASDEVSETWPKKTTFERNAADAAPPRSGEAPVASERARAAKNANLTTNDGSVEGEVDAKSDVTRVAAAASVVRATVTHIFVGRSIPHDSNTSHLNHSGAGVTTYDANI